jgi:hypothetical protein
LHDAAFGADVDFAQLVKIYGPAIRKGPERKYSPEYFCGTSVSVATGDPDASSISTSFVERQNLTMRMSKSNQAPRTLGCYWPI